MLFRQKREVKRDIANIQYLLNWWKVMINNSDYVDQIDNIATFFDELCVNYGETFRLSRAQINGNFLGCELWNVTGTAIFL